MAIHLPLSKLSLWQKIAFCTGLLERMLPNYALFSTNAEFGNVAVLKNQLNLLWQRLDKRQKIKINYDAQQAKLEEQIPEPEEFDFFAVFPALDTTMALLSLFQAMQDNEDDEGFANVSRLSENSVSSYVELLLAQDQEEITEQDITEHPLMVWEKEMQNELFDLILTLPETQKSCQIIKEFVLAEGISSLGFEIEN